MSIEYSDHAKRQIKERKILLINIVETIRNSSMKAKSFKNRKLRQKRFGSKILEVVTVTEGSKITVITAYYLGVNDEN